MGATAAAGVLLALWSLGSACGGLVYGALRNRPPLNRVHLAVAAGLPVSLLPMAAAPSVAAMALIVIPAGMFVAPLLATRNELIGWVAPEGSRTEAYTWPVTAFVGGIAIGSALAGTLVEKASWRTAFVVAAAFAFVGTIVAVTRLAHGGGADAGMNVLALYDIHGNVDALEAVLADERASDADVVVVGGDAVPGPFARDTLARLEALDVPVHWIRGNGEREVAEAVDGPVPADDDLAARTAAMTAAEIGDDAARALGEVPLTLELDGVLYCHASPRRDDEMLTRISPPERWAEALGDVDAGLVIAGHTHQQDDRHGRRHALHQRRQRRAALRGRQRRSLAVGGRRRARAARDRLRRRRGGRAHPGGRMARRTLGRGRAHRAGRRDRRDADLRRSRARRRRARARRSSAAPACRRRPGDRRRRARRPSSNSPRS